MFRVTPDHLNIPKMMLVLEQDVWMVEIDLIKACPNGQKKNGHDVIVSTQPWGSRAHWPWWFSPQRYLGSCMIFPWVWHMAPGHSKKIVPRYIQDSLRNCTRFTSIYDICPRASGGMFVIRNEVDRHIHCTYFHILHLYLWHVCLFTFSYFTLSHLTFALFSICTSHLFVFYTCTFLHLHILCFNMLHCPILYLRLCTAYIFTFYIFTSAQFTPSHFTLAHVTFFLSLSLSFSLSLSLSLSLWPSVL